jgi:hypothetical protein
MRTRWVACSRLRELVFHMLACLGHTHADVSMLPDPARVPAPRRWQLALVCGAAAILPSCGAEGEGSIHVGRAPTSKVAVLPDRKPLAPTRTPTGTTTPKAGSPRR